MAATKLNDVVTRLSQVLATINGAGVYNFDLSATGRILVGDGIPIGAPEPCVCLGDGPLRVEASGHSQTWTYRKTVSLMGIAPAADSSSSARITAGNKLVMDLVNALCGDRRLRGQGASDLVYDLKPNIETLEGVALDLDTQVLVAGSVEVTWEARSIA